MTYWIITFLKLNFSSFSCCKSLNLNVVNSDLIKSINLFFKKSSLMIIKCLFFAIFSIWHITYYTKYYLPSIYQVIQRQRFPFVKPFFIKFDLKNAFYNLPFGLSLSPYAQQIMSVPIAAMFRHFGVTHGYTSMTALRLMMTNIIYLL